MGQVSPTVLSMDSIPGNLVARSVNAKIVLVVQVTSVITRTGVGDLNSGASSRNLGDGASIADGLVHGFHSGQSHGSGSRAKSSRSGFHAMLHVVYAVEQRKGEIGRWLAPF